MNKKGFTLIEVLAVIVILGVVMLIGTVSITGVRNSINKSMFKTKLELAIGSAKTWGQDNRESLTSKDAEGRLYAYITINQLLENGTLTSDEIVDGQRVVTNDVDKTIVNDLKFKTYIEYNRVYACIEVIGENKNVLGGQEAWDSFSDFGLYCN